MAQNSLVKWALFYRKSGISVFPVVPPEKDSEGKDKKKPLVKWEPYQKEIASEEQIEAWWSQWPSARIGFATGALSNLYVVDCDSKEVYERLQVAYLSDSLVTPIAQTPKGYHVYFQNVPELRNQAKVKGMALDTRGEGGYVVAPPSPSINGKAYRWLVNPWENKPAMMPSALFKVFKDIKDIYLNNSSSAFKDLVKTSSTRTPSGKSHQVSLDFGQGSRDQTLFHVANHLVKGRMPVNQIEQLLTLVAEKVCNPPFPQKEISIKIKSALQRSENQERNLTEEVREWVLSSSGFFTSSEVLKCLQLSSRQERKNLSQILIRLSEEKLIEKHGDKNATWRRVEKEFTEVNLSEIEDIETFDITLPFGMQKYVDIFPKDLIVFAGAPNAGKTAIMLETLRLNQKRHKCFYFSSEMGKFNCKKRLSKHTECEHWNFTFVEDFKNFVDVVQPDHLNFIDYVEVLEGRYYEIPGILAQIQRKLRNGLALVALQKNPDKKAKDGRISWAIGGPQTLAKPAIFVTIDAEYPGVVMRIVKAKNYKDENPNGYQLHFRIKQGINLLPDGIWSPE